MTNIEPEELTLILAAVQKVQRERDELRAENERLTRRASHYELNWQNAEHVITLRDAENERLRAQSPDRRLIQANDAMLTQRDTQIRGLEARLAQSVSELERLRAALSDLLELHEDEPNRPAVRMARETLGNAKE